MLLLKECQPALSRGALVDRINWTCNRFAERSTRWTPRRRQGECWYSELLASSTWTRPTLVRGAWLRGLRGPSKRIRMGRTSPNPMDLGQHEPCRTHASTGGQATIRTSPMRPSSGLRNRIVGNRAGREAAGRGSQAGPLTLPPQPGTQVKAAVVSPTLLGALRENPGA